jgi:predicted transcriptional regulator
MADETTFENSTLPLEEDDATLAAIDQGAQDAAAGRTLPIEEVRKLLPQWISASSSPKKR